MAHREWCGRACSDCEHPCALDEKIPCSPDCENLFSNGERNVLRCKEIGCDAVEIPGES